MTSDVLPGFECVIQRTRMLELMRMQIRKKTKGMPRRSTISRGTTIMAITIAIVFSSVLVSSMIQGTSAYTIDQVPFAEEFNDTGWTSRLNAYTSIDGSTWYWADPSSWREAEKGYDGTAAVKLENADATAKRLELHFGSGMPFSGVFGFDINLLGTWTGDASTFQDLKLTGFDFTGNKVWSIRFHFTRGSDPPITFQIQYDSDGSGNWLGPETGFKFDDRETGTFGGGRELKGFGYDRWNSFYVDFSDSAVYYIRTAGASTPSIAKLSSGDVAKIQIETSINQKGTRVYIDDVFAGPLYSGAPLIPTPPSSSEYDGNDAILLINSPLSIDSAVTTIKDVHVISLGMATVFPSPTNESPRTYNNVRIWGGGWQILVKDGSGSVQVIGCNFKKVQQIDCGSIEIRENADATVTVTGSTFINPGLGHYGIHHTVTGNLIATGNTFMYTDVWVGSPDSTYDFTNSLVNGKPIFFSKDDNIVLESIDAYGQVILCNADNFQIKGGSISHASHPIVINHCLGGIISGVTLVDNGHYSISLMGSRNIVVEGCTIDTPGLSCLFLGANYDSLPSNHIIRNNIMLEGLRSVRHMLCDGVRYEGNEIALTQALFDGFKDYDWAISSALGGTAVDLVGGNDLVFFGNVFYDYPKVITRQISSVYHAKLFSNRFIYTRSTLIPEQVAIEIGDLDGSWEFNGNEFSGFSTAIKMVGSTHYNSVIKNYFHDNTDYDAILAFDGVLVKSPYGDNEISEGFNNSISQATIAEVDPYYPYYETVRLSRVTQAAGYQVKIQISGSTVDYAHIEDDGSDIRFVGLKWDEVNSEYIEVVAHYWIESYNEAGTSTIWVEVPDVDTATIVMRYGETQAVAQSSGTATFVLFDNFDTYYSTSDPNFIAIWYVYNYGSIATVTLNSGTGILTIEAGKGLTRPCASTVGIGQVVPIVNQAQTYGLKYDKGLFYNLWKRPDGTGNNYYSTCTSPTTYTNTLFTSYNPYHQWTTWEAARYYDISASAYTARFTMPVGTTPAYHTSTLPDNTVALPVCMLGRTNKWGPGLNYIAGIKSQANMCTVSQTVGTAFCARTWQQYDGGAMYPCQLAKVEVDWIYVRLSIDPEFEPVATIST